MGGCQFFLQVLIDFLNNIDHSPSNTHRNWKVMICITSVEFPAEAQDSMSGIFVAKKKNVVLGGINHWFTIAVLFHMSILEDKSKKKKREFQENCSQRKLDKTESIHNLALLLVYLTNISQNREKSLIKLNYDHRHSRVAFYQFLSQSNIFIFDLYAFGLI